MLKWALVAFAVLIASPSLAADPGANGVVLLFIKACVPTIGQPEKIRAWAESMHLREITQPDAVKGFAGEGPKAALWSFSTPEGNFALAIRGNSGGCVAYAQKADPMEVETYFRKLVDGVKRPGIEVTPYTDQHDSGPVGDVHTLSYVVGAPGAAGGDVFILQTAERPGGPFQAWVEVAVGKNQ